MLKPLLAAVLVLTSLAMPVFAASGAELAKTPAYELLEALDLRNVVPRPGLRVEPKAVRLDGSYSVRITLDAKPVSAPFAARGLGILQVELANIKVVSLQAFDLLYNEGRLIGVFPVFAADPGLKWEAVQPRFFDLSPYYLDVPRSGAPSETERWKEFAGVYAKDQEAIRSFVEERYKPLADSFPNFAPNRLPYRLHEVDAKTGRWDSYEFSPAVFGRSRSTGTILSSMEPDEFLRLFKEPAPGRFRTVIPTFPTVYALYSMTPAELAYLRQVSKKFELPSDAKILVVGPGTGVDTWIASLRTSRPVVAIGINPLEVANTRAAALIAGFEVRAVIGDNVADERGNPRLPGERFDLVLWSMPAVWPEGFPAGHAPSLTDFWDGDVGAVVLKRFSRALPGLLEPGGHALLWNVASIVNGKDIVAEILETADTGKKVLTVDVELFKRRSRPAEEWFKDRLYAVSRPR